MREQEGEVEQVEKKEEEPVEGMKGNKAAKICKKKRNSASKPVHYLVRLLYSETRMDTYNTDYGFITLYRNEVYVNHTLIIKMKVPLMSRNIIWSN